MCHEWAPQEHNCESWSNRYKPVGPSNGPGYNPSCLKGDVGPAVAMQKTYCTSIIGKLDQYVILRREGNTNHGNSGHEDGEYRELSGSRSEWRCGTEWADAIYGSGRYTICFVLFPFLATLLALHIGELRGDLCVPPGDPTFYLHHGQIDRLWTIWQMKSSTRQYAIVGTNTMNNYPF